MITKKVNMLLRDYRPEHSEFQIENFIIGAQGDEWARYRQSLRELSARHMGMVESGKELVRINIKLKRLRGSWLYRIVGRKKIISLEEKRRELKLMRAPKLREYFALYRIAVQLKRQIGEIGNERRRQLEADMWIDKARRMAAIDLLSIGGLQRSTVEFISSFPRELKRVLLSDLRPENRQKLLSILD